MCGICGFIWDDTESGEVSALRGRFTERAGKARFWGVKRGLRRWRL